MNRRTAEPITRTSVAVLLWSAALLALGSLALGRAWGSALPTLILVLAAVVPMLVLRGVLRLGVSRWAATSVLVLLLVLLAYLLTAEAGTSLTGTITDAIPLLLTEPQPLEVRADLLAAPILLVAATGLLVGLRLANRGRVAPVAGAATLHVAGLLLTSGAADPYGLLTGVLLLVTLAGWALLDDHTEPARRRTAVLAPVAAAAVAGVALSAAVPVSNAFDPREVVHSPLIDVEAGNPLPQLGAWGANPQLEIMRVNGPETPMRLVALSEFDGAAWSAATEYARLGTAQHTGLAPGLRQEEYRQDVELLNLVGPWLPVPGRPTQLSLREALLDPATGTVHLADRPDGLHYSVTGRVDAPAPEQLAGATVPTTGPFADYLAVPNLPYSLAEYSGAATQGAATPYDRALAIEAAIRGDRSFSPTSISGSAYWRIERFLLGDEDQPGGQVGSSEQFATAFAIVARQNGLPTRIVVGFRPGTEQPDGTRIIHGEDAMAWPEVYFDQLGWVPFSPLPDDDTFTRPDVDRPPIDPNNPDENPSEDSTPINQIPPHSGDEGGDTTASTTSSTGPILLRVVTAAAGLLVLPLVVLLLLRMLRSARHRRKGARGAWAEVLDVLVLAGLAARGHESATDVASRAGQVLETDAVGAVAALAERSAFGPDGETGAWPAQVREVRRRARRHVRLWRRLLWPVDPRPLRR